MKKLLKILFEDRTFRSLLLAVLMIAVMGSLRPEKAPGLYPKQYWAMKMQWHHCADMVLLGDSRTFMGLSPTEMQKKLTDYRVYNYAFPGNGYSEDYLKSAYDVLDPKSKAKSIVLGISPHSLIEKALEQNGFMQERSVSPQDLFVNIHLACLVNFFEPMSFRDALHGLVPALKPSKSYMEYFADGWVAGDRNPREIKHRVKRYHNQFSQNPVSNKPIQDVMNYVKKWAGQGVRIYGFRPPTCTEMFEMENQISGFDQEKFVADFQLAGGVWIDVDQTAYYSHDGSHLRYDAALELSRTVAQQIYNLEHNIDATEQLSRKEAD